MDVTHVTHYSVYVGLYSSAFRTTVGGDDVPVGTNEYFIADNFAIDPTWTDVMVYTKSSLVQQTTPLVEAYPDSIESVASLSFTDKDLDPQEFGGLVSWSPPVGLDRTVWYAVYTATGPAGEGRAQVGSLIPIGTNQLAFTADNSVGVYTHILLYTRSLHHEQTTPVATALEDRDSTVASAVFIDRDLDVGEIGGVVLRDFKGTVSPFFDVFLALFVFVLVVW